MGLLTGLIEMVPGFRHIALGRCLAGVSWFAAFAAVVNAGLLAPVVWPGAAARLARWGLYAAAVILAMVSHARASRIERERRRAAARAPREGPPPSASP